MTLAYEYYARTFDAGSSTSFVEKWRKQKSFSDDRYLFGLGFGSDMNGFSNQGGPPRRTENPISYPFTGLGGVTVHKQVSGEKVYDPGTNAWAPVASMTTARERHTESMGILRNIIAQYPNYLPAYNALAEAYVQIGKSEDAIEVLQAGLKRAPDDAVLLNNLGMAHFLREEYADALPHFERAAERRPEVPLYRANKAATLGMLGRARLRAVGAGFPPRCLNRPDDVRKIQTSLNRFSPGEGGPVDPLHVRRVYGRYPIRSGWCPAHHGSGAARGVVCDDPVQQGGGHPRRQAAAPRRLERIAPRRRRVWSAVQG